MSDTPETDAAILESKRQWFFAIKECSQRLERERDKGRALLCEMKVALKWAKDDAKERLHRLDQAACERRTWMEARHQMQVQRDQWRELAEKLALAIQYKANPYDALAELERLKRGSQ